MAKTRDVARASLYRAPINLWVEDEVSRAYLAEIWSNPAVGFLIGGGSEGVRAIVHDAGASRFANVFALIDRDFRETNKQHWSDPRKTFRTFVLPVHEIENYLLDARALASIRSNNLRKTEQQVDTIMTSTASQLSWWAACREVVAELRKRFCEDFLEHPKCTVDTEEKARDLIIQSPWFQRIPAVAKLTTESNVLQMLSDAHANAKLAIVDERWKDEFAGKEILRIVGSQICDRNKFPNYSPTKAEFDVDIAKEIGAWQRLNNAIPSDLLDLLEALKLRISRPPSAR